MPLLFYTPGVTTQVSPRLGAIDRLRGLIIVLMILDHASYFIARVHPLETWASPWVYGDAASFLTRWVTHLCAPGFFLLMGIGITRMAESRRTAGWTTGQIRRLLVTRGIVLLVVQHVIENPAWLLGTLSLDPALGGSLPELPGAPGEIMLSFGVLSALGVALIVAAALWNAPAIVLGAGAVVVMAAVGNLQPTMAEAHAAIPVWRLLLLVPGANGPVQVLYPWIPWVPPLLLGLMLGRPATWDRELLRTVWTLGAVLTGMFVLLRVFGVGDAHAPGDGVIGFLTVTKYPPGEVFFAVTLGIDLLLLAALLRWSSAPLAWLEVYGRAPFFVYLAHLWLLAGVSVAFPTGASFVVMYAVWGLVVVALYPAAVRYDRFKRSQPPTSLWRLL
jgi:uncharacterized membrane protein